jgi:hypothetical protein
MAREVRQYTIDSVLIEMKTISGERANPIQEGGVTPKAPHKTLGSGQVVGRVGEFHQSMHGPGHDDRCF